MESKKVYIAGKVTGLPHAECVAKFEAAAQQVKALGFTAVNPMEVVNNPQCSWMGAMRLCIAALMGCDFVYALPCHLASTGALLEIKTATAVGIPVKTNISGLKS